MKINNKFIKKVTSSKVLLVLVTVAILFLGIGYAQISDIDLDISGTASAQGQNGIVISDITYLSSNNADSTCSNINTYYQTMFDSKICLNNDSSSSITYQIKIKNLTSNNAKFIETIYADDFYDNDDITFELDGLAPNDIIQADEEKTFNITFKYKEVKDSYPNTILNSYINFKFGDTTSGHTITYDNTIDTTGHNYPTTVSDHGTVSFYFADTKPTTVYVNGEPWDGYNMNTGKLIVNDVTENLVISADYTTVGKAIFDTYLRNKLIAVANGSATNVTSIQYASEIPADATTTEVQSNSSVEKIYMWFDNGTIYWNSANKNPTLSGNYRQLFNGFSNLTNIDGLRTWDTYGLTNTEEFFKGCTNLTSAEPLRYWDMSKNTNLQGFFNGSTNLNDITGIGNWDVSSVTTITSMFVSSGIANISPLSTWNVSNIQKMSGVFQQCRSLADISALANWNPASATETIQMFQDTIISDLSPLSGWNVSNVKDMRQMFYRCKQVTSIEALSNWTTTSLTSLNNTFAQMTALASLNGLGNWDVSHVTNFSNIFDGSNSIRSISAVASWNVSAGTNYTSMFHGNKYLSVDEANSLNSWQLNPSGKFTNMFNGNTNKPTFYFDVDGVPTPGTWNSSGTLIPPE